MRDQIDGPTQSATENPEAAQPNPAQTRRFGPLSAIPAMEQPDVALVGKPEYAELLMTTVRRRARIHGRLVGLAAAIPLVLMVVLWVLHQDAIAMAVTAVAAFVVFLRWMGIGPLARTYRAVIPLDGQSMTIRFGPDAFDLQGPGDRVRFPHSRFRAIQVEPETITLRMRNTLITFPRELFPDTAIDYLRARLAGHDDVAAPPPLPSLPPLGQPTAQVTAGPDTASQLAWAVTWRSNRQLTQLNAIVAVTLVLTAVVVGGERGLAAGAFAAGVIILVVLAARLTAAVIDFARMQRGFTAYAADGDVLATRFGPDAFAVRTAEMHSHIRYDRIAKLTVRRHTVLMTHGGRATAYPRELFPDTAIAHIRAANPSLL
ncbi:hypothetical protein [Nocardia pseudobrasiliensis]|uniref:YcxB-like protein n=1 Tax=Nocardia pseudobrasiliensis TaxID=45979 RepID=A0A370I4V4_9NOCA|nr:hypothetical protein [Nocardia pseudobrasiliensis]RDI65739.1 hypothetical protein DFR76_10554 [Nocardia pseudobrasiliensis]